MSQNEQQQFSKPRRGFFVAIEGPDFVGKSTVTKMLVDLLTKYGQDVVQTRQPGGSQVGNKIRELIINEDSLDPMAELLLFEADRVQCIEKVIKPALGRRKIVVCDRWSLSTYAYQGAGRGLAIDSITAIEQQAHGPYHPDLVIYLSASFETVRERMARAVQERGGADRFETVDFQRKVWKAYESMVTDHAVVDPTKVVALDVNGTLEQVSQLLDWCIKQFILNNRD